MPDGLTAHALSRSRDFIGAGLEPRSGLVRSLGGRVPDPPSSAKDGPNMMAAKSRQVSAAMDSRDTCVGPACSWLSHGRPAPAGWEAEAKASRRRLDQSTSLLS